ncbi:MAG TPA: hypothetical protein VG410_12350 [Solirubrobacteraceae bacterium]|nr:hypothetical protein [Solirubrobacteraceae bacterium]
MKANRAFHLIVAREGLEPAFLADRDRLDRIEVVSVEDGEIAWYWELPPKDASKLVRELRGDLVALEVDEFIDRWVGADE